MQGTQTIQANSAGRTAAIPLKAAYSDWGSSLGRIAFKHVSALGAASVWNTWHAHKFLASSAFVLFFCIFCGPLRGNLRTQRTVKGTHPETNIDTKQNLRFQAVWCASSLVSSSRCLWTSDSIFEKSVDRAFTEVTSFGCYIVDFPPKCRDRMLWLRPYCCCDGLENVSLASNMAILGTVSMFDFRGVIDDQSPKLLMLMPAYQPRMARRMLNTQN